MNKQGPVRYFSLHRRIALFLLIVTSIVIGALVFTIGHSSLFIEIQITLTIIALCLFSFMAIGLHHGVRVEKDSVRVEATSVGSGWSWDWLSFFNLGSIPMPESHHVDIPGIGDIGGGDDLAGCLVSLLIWLVVTILIVAFIAVVVPFIGSAIIVVFTALYWVFYQALRQVFARSRYCRGNWSRALVVSLIFTTIYIGWLIALISARNLLPLFLK